MTLEGIALDKGEDISAITARKAKANQALLECSTKYNTTMKQLREDRAAALSAA